MNERKIQAMHKRFGTCGVFRCKDCNHFKGGNYHGRSYYKCELYGMTRGEGTDWRLAWQACGAYNMPFDLSRWVPLVEQIKHEPKAQPPIDGQVHLEV